MKLIDDLRAEHDLIDEMLGSLRTFVDRRFRGEGDPVDGARFTEFFRLFAGDFHHAREEGILFPALQQQADLPAQGPITVLTHDHHRLAGLLDELGPLLASPSLDRERQERLRSLIVQYTHALWHHIDAENSVLLPEGEARLAKKGVRELSSREITPAEAAARDAAGRLIALYPPTPDTTVVRGEGCVCCQAFGESCRGLEREWWNEWEWEEFEEHLGGD